MIPNSSKYPPRPSVPISSYNVLLAFVIGERREEAWESRARKSASRERDEKRREEDTLNVMETLATWLRLKRGSNTLFANRRTSRFCTISFPFYNKE